jgi:hypothetical protein
LKEAKFGSFDFDEGCVSENSQRIDKFLKSLLSNTSLTRTAFHGDWIPFLERHSLNLKPKIPHLELDHLPSSTKLGFLRFWTNLTSLSITFCLPSKEMIDAISDLTKLQKLRLHSRALLDNENKKYDRYINFETFQPLQKLTDLESVEMEGFYPNQLSGIPKDKIKKLGLGYVDNLEDGDLAMIQGCTNLESISLDGWCQKELNFSGLRNLTQIKFFSDVPPKPELGNIPLRILELPEYDNGLSKETLSFLECVKDCKLETLVIGRQSFTTDESNSASSQKFFQTRSTIIFSSLVNLTCRNYDWLPVLLFNCPKLKYLILSKISSKRVEDIDFGDIIENCPSLIYLECKERLTKKESSSLAKVRLFHPDLVFSVI